MLRSVSLVTRVHLQSSYEEPLHSSSIFHDLILHGLLSLMVVLVPWCVEAAAADAKSVRPSESVVVLNRTIWTNYVVVKHMDPQCHIMYLQIYIIEHTNNFHL